MKIATLNSRPSFTKARCIFFCLFSLLSFSFLSLSLSQEDEGVCRAIKLIDDLYTKFGGPAPFSDALTPEVMAEALDRYTEATVPVIRQAVLNFLHQGHQLQDESDLQKLMMSFRCSLLLSLLCLYFMYSFYPPQGPLRGFPRGKVCGHFERNRTHAGNARGRRRAVPGQPSGRGGYPATDSRTPAGSDIGSDGRLLESEEGRRRKKENNITTTTHSLDLFFLFF